MCQSSFISLLIDSEKQLVQGQYLVAKNIFILYVNCENIVVILNVFWFQFQQQCWLAALAVVVLSNKKQLIMLVDNVDIGISTNNQDTVTTIDPWTKLELFIYNTVMTTTVHIWTTQLCLILFSSNLLKSSVF